MSDLRNATAPSPAPPKDILTARQLIINADDFGFNREITDGIIEAHARGVVTSTTIMINMPAAEYAVERAKDFPNLSIGLHVNLTAGKPLSDAGEVSSLVGEDGMFVDQMTFFRRGMLNQFNAAHLEIEMRRQFQRAYALGLTPSHADSHHHAASCWQPFFIKLRLLKEFGISKMRTHRGWYHRDRGSRGLSAMVRTVTTNLRRSPFRIYYEVQHAICRRRGICTPTERYGFKKVVSNKPLEFDMASVPSLLKTMPTGVCELCCHPGYLSEDPLDEPDFRVQRPRELAFFTNPALRASIEQADINLISFREL